MGHSPFQEANSSSAGQEILRILWDRRVPKNPPLVPTHSQMNPENNRAPYVQNTFQHQHYQSIYT